MGAQKKGSTMVSEEQSHQRLQAILLADTFTTDFNPITLELPKVLLPLVNVPMIDYTLAWLEYSGIEEVFVFCCSHSMQLIEYLKKSEWHSHPNMSLRTIEYHESMSVGDALRYIYEEQIEKSQIQGDFVLVSGDTVSNIPLAELIQEHRVRKKKDEKAIMTMLIKKSKPSPLNDQVFIGVNSLTKQLVYYDEDDDENGAGFLGNSNQSVSVYNDMKDCCVNICSLEVLSLFEDNFDYQDLRDDFVKGLLADDDITGYKIFTHEIRSSYVARVDDLRSYDMLSKDIIQRWTFPYVPDMKFSGKYHSLKLGRQGIYRASDAILSRSADVGASTVIGHGTRIESGGKILNSVIGNGCCIGSNVVIEGSYIWNNVTIEDGCVIKNAIVCDEVKIRAGSVLQPGVVLSFKVVVGMNIVVPMYSKVSLLQQPSKKDHSDEDSSSDTETADLLSKASELGPDGVGYIWEGAHDEEWKHSIAPILKEKLAEISQAIDDDDIEDESVVLPSESDSDNSDLNDSNDVFEKLVESTFLWVVEDNVDVKNATLEITNLRLVYNKDSEDCAGAIFYSMMRLAVNTLHNSASELYSNATSIITKWKGLFGLYIKKIDEQIEVIMKFEEMCEESFNELGPLFVQILHFLYEEDVLQEDAILRWAEEKEGADESDKVYVKQCETFIEWLKEASEEEEDED